MILGFKQKFPWGEPTKFKEKIQSCKKIHSIREGERWKPGMLIHMAYGVRTKNYENFLNQVCISVQQIIISPNAELVMIDGKGLNQYTKQLLAENDGFDTFEDFQKWFKTGLTRKGQIIHWTDYRY